MTLPLPQLADNPITVIQAWLEAAHQTEPNDANAAALATASAAALPSVRMVLVKEVGESGFIFYTNGESRKGHELAENPQAALCFYWKSLARQVRVEGACMPIETAASDAYFHARDRASQLASAASKQSRTLQNPEAYAEDIQRLESVYKNQPIPRPQAWQGYAITPTAIELWVAGENRRHVRIRYEKTASGWQGSYLYP